MTDTDPALITVVIPSWNKRDHLAQCLDSLVAQTYAHVQIVVVDNASTDGSADMVAADYPDVTLLRQSRNHGIAGGVNRGIAAAKGNCIALLNQDAVADRNWVAELAKLVESDQRIGVVQSKMLRVTDGSTPIFDSSGDQYSLWGRPRARDRDRPDAGQREQVEEVFSACGGASLYTRAVIDDVGTFDEDFFLYYEDTDLSFRARLKGYKVVYCPTALVSHHVGLSSKESPSALIRFHVVKNLHLLYFRNMPTRLMALSWPLFTVTLAGAAVNSLRRGVFKAHLRALWWLVRNSRRVLAERREIQGSRRVTTAELRRFVKLRP